MEHFDYIDLDNYIGVDCECECKEWYDQNEYENNDSVHAGFILSVVMTIINIVLWSGAIFPQIYKNYKLKSSDAISFILIVMWSLGSTLSIVSAHLKNGAASIIYTGIYNLIISFVLLAQYIYFRYCNKKQLTDFEKGLLIISFVIIFVVCLYVLFNEKNKIYIVGDLIAWFTLVIHTFARIPQILLNWTAKSVFGLSKTAFIFITFSNVFFLTSIFVISIDLPFHYVFLNNIQWIIGSILGLLCDVIILYQFKLYKNNLRSGYEEI